VILHELFQNSYNDIAINNWGKKVKLKELASDKNDNTPYNFGNLCLTDRL